MMPIVVTFFFDTQKKSVQGESIFTEATCTVFGLPVRAEAEQFINICFHEANIYTPICTYFTSSESLGWSVTSQDVVDFLCVWMAKIGFLWLGSTIKTLAPICSILVGP